MRTQHNLTIIAFSLCLSLTSWANTLNLIEAGSLAIAEQIRAIPPASSAQNLTFQPTAEPALVFTYPNTLGEQQVSVFEQLPVTIMENGQDTGTGLYNAIINDEEALLSLRGDTIQISYNRFDGTNITTMHTVINQNTAIESVLSPKDFTQDSPQQLESIPPQTEHMQPQNSQPNAQPKKAQADSAAPPLTIHIFRLIRFTNITNDRIMHKYLSWWIKHMDEINKEHKEQGNRPLFNRIILNWVSNQPFDTVTGDYSFAKYRNLSYREAIDAFMGDFRRDVDSWAPKQDIRPPVSHTKFLLMSNYIVYVRMTSSTMKLIRVMGDQNRHTGFTTFTHDNLPAHALGVMMGADSKYSTTKYKFPWFCETITVPVVERSAFKANCYKYSQKNQALIIEHLSQW